MALGEEAGKPKTDLAVHSEWEGNLEALKKRQQQHKTPTKQNKKTHTNIPKNQTKSQTNNASFIYLFLGKERGFKQTNLRNMKKEE